MALSNFTELKAEILEFLERTGDAAVTGRLDTIVPLAESWINRRLGGYQREIKVTLIADAVGDIALPVGFTGVKTISMNRRPYRYSVSGSTLTVESGANGTFDLVYLSRLVPLTDANPTNWLLDAAPDAYLDACLMRACIFLQDAAAAQGYGGTAGDSLDELTKQNMAAQYSNASLKIAGQVP